MKRVLLLLTILVSSALFAQQERSNNRYSMTLEKENDNTYSLVNSDRYAKIIDLQAVPDLLTPYKLELKRLKYSDYKGVETREFVYKTYPDYELKLAVDMAVSEKPAPFMVYIHGGGWARGDFGANRDLSQYCAKQAGTAGVRISYTLADKPGANVNVTIADVADAVKWIKAHAKELNIDPSRFGFMGGSAGGHLAAMAAMTIPETKVLVGVSGIYNLQTAKISSKTTDKQRIAYFLEREETVLKNASPVNFIPKKNIPATLLIHGTGDIVVEYQQSEEFNKALKAKSADVTLRLFEFYDHNVGSTKSDMKEEVFFTAFDFIKKYIFQ